MPRKLRMWRDFAESILELGRRRRAFNNSRARTIQHILRARREPAWVPTALRPTFVVGVGRSGTHFLGRLFAKDRQVESYHLDDIGMEVGDSLQFYLEWNQLPIDREPFLQARGFLMQEAAVKGRTYLESNPYLALSVDALHERFRSRFIFVVRDPVAVVDSHCAKGWYRTTPLVGNPELAAGYQYDLRRPNHAIGRIVPRAEEFERWCRLTQVGRVAWMWNAVNMAVIDALEHVPGEDRVLVQIESLDYSEYRRLNAFVGGATPMTAAEFDALRRSRPGKRQGFECPVDWGARPWAEFLEETRRARQRLKMPQPERPSFDAAARK